MTSLKLLVVVTLAVAVVAQDSEQGGAESGSLDVVVGERETDDFLVHEQEFIRQADPNKKIVAFRPFDVPDEYSITQVRAIDQSGGTGGYCTHEYGGPRMTRVLLGFHSKINQGINYRVELYGKLYKPN